MAVDGKRDGRGESELNPIGKGFGQEPMRSGQMPAHFERENGNGERKRDPEAAGHVDEFGARAGRSRCDLRLQRHPADRAVSGMALTNLRMHGAGVDRARGGVLAL